MKRIEVKAIRGPCSQCTLGIGGGSDDDDEDDGTVNRMVLGVREKEKKRETRKRQL